MAGPIFRLLVKKAGSSSRARAAVSATAEMVGILGGDTMDEKLSGLALCAGGESPDLVSKLLTWKDFEGFSSSILRAGGYAVRENIYLKKPRAQIDVVGVRGEVSLAIDCKHWAASSGYRTLSRLVEAQRARSRRLHDSLDSIPPVASVILTLVDPGVRFVGGGAVVPISVFRDFLGNAESFREFLAWE